MCTLMTNINYIISIITHEYTKIQIYFRGTGNSWITGRTGKNIK